MTWCSAAGRRRPALWGYRIPPQTVANGIPGAQPAPGDPLAGLDDLAVQVAAAGVETVDGDVVVDDRLWQTWDTADGLISPMVVNDNLLDVVVTPTEPGQPPAVRTIPETAAYRVFLGAYMINASFPQPATGIIDVGDDLGAVAAGLQQAL